jgi:hypothetical protein
MRTRVGNENRYWIGGKVIPDGDYPWDFYFNPNTIVIAEMTAEGMQTTIRQITQDPEYYANNGFPNDFSDHAWYVLGVFLQYRLISPHFFVQERE